MTRAALAFLALALPAASRAGDVSQEQVAAGDLLGGLCRLNASKPQRASAYFLDLLRSSADHTAEFFERARAELDHAQPPASKHHEHSDGRRAVVLASEPPPNLPPREVALKWFPPGATLDMFGRESGTTRPGNWTGKFDINETRHVMISSPCCDVFESDITVGPGDGPMVQNIVLVPKTGRFLVELNPPMDYAEVSTDSKHWGTVADVRDNGGIPVKFSKDDDGDARVRKTVKFDVRLPDQSVLHSTVRARAGETVTAVVPIKGAP